MNKLNIKHLEIVLKIVERCNLNCSYCYFFNGGDKSYLKHPAFISEKVIEDTIKFLVQAHNDLGLEKIKISLHGGEPLLLKPILFDKMCTRLRQNLDPLLDLELFIQSNGVLIDDEWISLFSKHNVFVGVSCDGPPEFHDKYRLDFKGKGSYAKMKVGIDKLLSRKNELPGIGIVSVVDSEHDAKAIYKHFTKDLNVPLLNLLMPHYSHEDFKGNALGYGKFLSDLFEAWVEDDDPNVYIHMIDRSLKVMTMSTNTFQRFAELEDQYGEITIATNGQLGTIDVLRHIEFDFLANENNISNISLAEYFESPKVKYLRESLKNLPDGCQNCCWKNACRGGYVTHRFSKERHLNNPSIYCEGLKKYHSKIAQYLLRHGYPMEKLEALLYEPLKAG
jgi:uncharacterized protein